MSVFYSLTPKILLEIDYTQVQFNNVDFPLKKISDGNEKAVILTNDSVALDYTNNPETTVYVTTDDTGKAILDKDTAYFYPNYSENIIIESIPQVNVGLNYISVKLHLLAGYSFQEIEGVLFSMWVLSNTNEKVYLLKQSFLKAQINRYKYNNISKNFGDFYYDKYIEFFVLDYNDYSTYGINYGFLKEVVTLANNPVIFASIGEIEEVSYKNGFAKVSDLEQKMISFAPRDEFDLLTAYISENEKGFLEYGARWDGQPIENFIFRINSIKGNAYYIQHELEIFEQHGNSLVEVETITQIQTKDYDKLKRLRFIVSGNANGGVKVKYVVRLYDKNTGDSIIKEATLSILNISPYLEDITKINVQQLESPIKVYNKIVSESFSINKAVNKLSKVIVPLYVNSANVVVEEGFVLKLSQFDNFYEMKLFKKTETGLSVFYIEPKMTHKIAFTKANGSNIFVLETVDSSKRKFGIISFKISSIEAKNIIANDIKVFSIITESENITTKLTDGKIEY